MVHHLFQAAMFKQHMLPSLQLIRRFAKLIGNIQHWRLRPAVLNARIAIACHAKLQIEQAEGMLSDPANAEAVAFYERSQDRETARAAGALAIGSEPNTILAPILLPQREIQTNFSSKHLAFLGFREGKDCQRERLRE